MNTRTLNEVVDDALAEIGFDSARRRRPTGRQRSTEWLGSEAGFGLRHYPNGRSVYIVQARMGGRNRTVTIGSDALLTKAQAAKVARLVLAHCRSRISEIRAPVKSRSRMIATCTGNWNSASASSRPNRRNSFGVRKRSRSWVL